MNRKRKLNELYKGVFKNDKKSCIVDLKPLDRKRELEAQKEAEVPREDNRLFQEPKMKAVSVSLKVNKNLGFGSYFENLREEIVQIFTAKEDLISFEGMMNSHQVNELFNGNFHSRESTNKNLINNLEKISDLNTVNNNIIQEDFFEEEILYEDEVETIYKRKKPQSRRMEREYGLEDFYNLGINKSSLNHQNIFPSKNKILLANENPLFDISNLTSNYNYTESQPEWNEATHFKFLPKNKNLIEELKPRKNKVRSEDLENSENTNSINFLSKF